MSRFTAASISSGFGRPSAWKAVEHVAQRGDREDARGELLRALEGVGDEVEHGVGEGLERGRRGRDLEAAELGHDAGRGLHRLDDAPVVDLAVGGEGLGGGRRPDRQLDLGRVGRGPGRGADLEPRRARAHRGHGKRTSTRSFAATTSRRPAPAVSAALRGAHGDVHRHLARRSGSAPRPAARSGRRSSGSAAATGAPSAAGAR